MNPTLNQTIERLEKNNKETKEKLEKWENKNDKYQYTWARKQDMIQYYKKKDKQETKLIQILRTIKNKEEKEE